MKGPSSIRWPWVMLLAAGISTSVSVFVYPRGSDIVVALGIDGYGWSYLFGLAAVLLAVASIAGLVYRLSRNRQAWWVDAIYIASLLVFIAGGTLGVFIALLGGALSFKNSYRDIGTVDGQAIVIQQFAGLDTDDMIDAGYRDGLLVTFRAKGDYYLKRPDATIGAWRFTVTTTSRLTVISYHAGSRPHQAGQLSLPRPAIASGTVD